MSKPRARLSWTVYLWPGLSQVTQWGSWTALFWALFTAFLADMALVTVYIWPETFAPGWGRAIASAFLGVYGVGCFLTWQMEVIRRGNVRYQDDEDLFIEAQAFYLQSLYFEAEIKLRELLRRQEEDVPARILLADLLKTTGKYRLALDEVEFLLKEPSASSWRWEIFTLQDRLKELLSEKVEEKTEEKKLPYKPSVAEEPVRQAA